MANLVVYSAVDHERQPHEETRLALAQARAVANSLGATVHALVAWQQPLDSDSLDDLAETLGLAGADRVVLWVAEQARPLALYETHGAMLEAIVKKLHPRLFMFPEGDAAVQLAAMLAARVSADFFPQASLILGVADLEHGSAGELRLHRKQAALHTCDELDVMEAERMVVCILANTGFSAPRGLGPAEIEVMALPSSFKSAGVFRAATTGGNAR